jgi:Transglycosylase SLT domain
VNCIRGSLLGAVARPAVGVVAVVVTLAGATLLPADAAGAARAGGAARAAGAARAVGAALAVSLWRPADELAWIPANYLTWYVEAARTCRGLAWEVLAGIGTMESNNGRSNARGVHQGKNRKGAEGPMQFEPATFAEYAVRIDRFQKLTPYNPTDAIFTAARMLCADGAASGSLPGLKRAIFAYNHAHWYVKDVLAIAARYTASARLHPPTACRPHRPHRTRPSRRGRSRYRRHGHDRGQIRRRASHARSAHRGRPTHGGQPVHRARPVHGGRPVHRGRPASAACG